MRTLLLLCPLLVGCKEDALLGDSDASVRDAAMPDALDPAYLSNWSGACCGLVCKPGQLCVAEADGAPQCRSRPDGGACNPGICDGYPSPFFGNCSTGGCDVGKHARCVDFPAACLATPTCACLVGTVEGAAYGNCQQHCGDSRVVSEGLLTCVGM